MYFYYKMYTICKLFYNTLSPPGSYVYHYTTFLYSLPPANPRLYKNLWFIYRFIQTTLCFL